jgi:hypothetical protein
MLSFASFAGKGLGGGRGHRNAGGGSRVKWHSPPPSASWAENTITESTRESGHLQSMCTLWCGVLIHTQVTDRLRQVNKNVLEIVVRILSFATRQGSMFGSVMTLEKI